MRYVLVGKFRESIKSPGGEDGRIYKYRKEIVL